jgi:arsenate reductase-like glutaredoxin family protein
VSFTYRHIVKEPLSVDELKDLAHSVGISVKNLINPKSKNFKELNMDLAELSEEVAADIIVENSKVMYRPLLSDGEQLVLGFKEEEFKAIIN